MSIEQIPYIHWGDYKSKDTNNSDILEIEVIILEQFESELSTNVHVKQKIDGVYEDRNLPLKSHESNNSSLLKQWNELVKKKRITVGSKPVIHTCLGISKHNRVIRRRSIEV